MLLSTRKQNTFHPASTKSDLGVVFNCDKKKGIWTMFHPNYLTLSLLLTTKEVFVDSVDQDQTAQNAQSDL